MDTSGLILLRTVVTSGLHTEKLSSGSAWPWLPPALGSLAVQVAMPSLTLKAELAVTPPILKTFLPWRKKMLKDGRSLETHFLKYDIYDPKYVDAFFIKNDPFPYV